jgi:hypothetical protein
MAIKIDIKKNPEAYYMLSYQGNTNIYDRVNIKKILAKAIIKNGGSELMSYTDSSIIFTGSNKRLRFETLHSALSNICNNFNPRVYFTLIIVGKIKNGDVTENGIHCEGDEILNERFKKMLETII